MYKLFFILLLGFSVSSCTKSQIEKLMPSYKKICGSDISYFEKENGKVRIICKDKSRLEFMTNNVENLIDLSSDYCDSEGFKELKENKYEYDFSCKKGGRLTIVK